MGLESEFINAIKSNYKAENMQTFINFANFGKIEEISSSNLTSLSDIIGNNERKDYTFVKKINDQLNDFFDNHVLKSIDWFSKDGEKINQKDFYKICGDVSLEESVSKRDKKVKMQTELRDFFSLFVFYTFICKTKIELNNKEIGEIIFNNLTEDYYIKKIGLKCKKESMSKSQPALHNFYVNLSKCCKKFILVDNKRVNDDERKQLIAENEKLSADSILMKIFTEELTKLIEDTLHGDPTNAKYISQQIDRLKNKLRFKL